jgi:predicted TIM-barrel fold metal-dependent hydrolase
MFAIDYPYEDSATAVDFLNSTPLTEKQRVLVSHANAERLFRIAPLKV